MTHRDGALFEKTPRARIEFIRYDEDLAGK